MSKQVVILAAGMGTRLARPLPKPLTELRDGRSIMQQQIDNLRTELELRRTLASNSPTSILERAGARRSASKGVFQGDPLPNRLDRIEKTSQSQ